MWNTRRSDDSEVVYDEPITPASQDVVASNHNYTALGPLKEPLTCYMSPPSDKDSTLLPTQDHVDVPKRIWDKKIILASILTVLIVSSAALILATIGLAKLSSDLARLDNVNAGLNARHDQQLSEVSGSLTSQELNISSISYQLMLARVNWIIPRQCVLVPVQHTFPAPQSQCHSMFT